MGRTWLTDGLGNPRGYVEDQGSYIYAYDKLGNVSAYYDKNADLTYDRYGRPIGKGNLIVNNL